MASLAAQPRPSIDWAKVDAETMQHFQALLRFDTSDPPTTPPGVEKPAVDYLKQVLDKEGIPNQVYALEANRPNLIARLKGNGRGAAAADHGAHRYGQRRPEEVDASRRSARRVTAATSTAAARSTTKTT